MECYIFPFSNRKGIRPVKQGVHLLVVMIWLEFCTTYSSNCNHHLHHPLLQYTPADPGSPGKFPLKRRDRACLLSNAGTVSKRMDESVVTLLALWQDIVLFYRYNTNVSRTDRRTSAKTVLCSAWIAFWFAIEIVKIWRDCDVILVVLFLQTVLSTFYDVASIFRHLNGSLKETNFSIYYFCAHHSTVFYFRCSVYWWKGSVRF